MAASSSPKSNLSEFGKSEHDSLKTLGSPYDLVKKISKQKSSSKFKESLLAETFERFRTRRLTVRMKEGSSYRLRAAASLHFRQEFGGVSCLRWAPKGNSIAAGFYSGDLRIFSTPRLSGRPVETTTILNGWEGNYPVSCIRFHPKSHELVYASSLAGTVTVGKTLPNEEDTVDKKVIIAEGENEINSFDFSCDAGALVTAGKDAILRVYDATTHKLLLLYSRQRWSMSTQVTELSTLSEECHEKRVYCVKCHPDQPRVFLTGGWDKVVKVWDTRLNGSCVRNIYGPYIFGEAIDICGEQLLTASCVAKDSLELWDLGSGRLVSRIIPSNKPVYLYGEFPYAVQFHKGGAGDLVLCGGTGLGGMQIISREDQMILHLVEDDRPVVAIDSSEKLTAFGGKSNCVSIVESRGELYEEQLLSTRESNGFSDVVELTNLKNDENEIIADERPHEDTTEH